MARHFGWSESAAKYVALYESMIPAEARHT